MPLGGNLGVKPVEEEIFPMLTFSWAAVKDSPRAVKANPDDSREMSSANADSINKFRVYTLPKLNR